jgi:3-oxoacyl-[acyl-carrier protein] reductase
MSAHKTLLVLGGSSDISIPLIKCVADRYEKIIVHYNKNIKKLDPIISLFGDKILPLQADFSDEAATELFAKKLTIHELAPEHIVHFPAAQCNLTHFPKQSWEAFRRGFDISVGSLVHVLKNILPIMAKKHSGKVIVMLTAYTKNSPPKFLSDYITIKYALLGLVKALATEYSSKGIQINGISPGMVDTKYLSSIPEIVVKQSSMSSILGHNLSVDEIIPFFDFLLKDEANAITGQNIGINVL